MTQLITFTTLAMLVTQMYAAPQFITVKNGKLGVNFGGYHAAVGLGGGQGLFAEAGTPHGQAASAGLGGIMGGNGNSGGLFAGATAGNGILAQAGLGGMTNAQNSAGAGYASAQYGNRIAAAGLGGEASESGSTGVKFAGTNVEPPKVIVQETVATVPVKPSVENEIDGFENVLPLNNANANVNVNTRTNVDTVVEKEVSSPWGYRREYRNYKSPFTLQTVMSSVFAEPGYIRHVAAKPRYQVHRLIKVRPVDTVIEKTKIYHSERPHHNVHKFAYFDTNAEKRSDVDVSATDNVGTHAGAGGQVTVNKEIHYQRNPTFFADIFNIPTQTIKAVANLLGSTADNTKVTVHKSVSNEGEIASRSAYAPESASSSVSTGSHIAVETQPASHFFDNIFAIPIDTLDAVRKFLENNVPARKRLQVSQTGEQELGAAAAANVRLGPHARRRAAKRVIVVDTSKPIEEGHQ